MKCPICEAGRSRLYTCTVCGKKLCGCCSVKSIVNGKRVCCYPSDGRTCREENRRVARAAAAAADEESGMTLNEQRDIAMGAARAALRKQGTEPADVDYTSALAALDDLARTNPNTIAAQWYANDNANQTRLFRQEWRRWREKEQERQRVFGAGQ